MTMDYPIVIVALSAEDGGGYMGRVPDLVGCMSDGATREEAVKNTEAAILEWIDAAEKRGLPVPEPGSFAKGRIAEKEELLAIVKKAMADVDHLESRLDEIEKAVEEIQAQYDHDKSWARFVAITGNPDIPGQGQQRALC